MRHAWALAFVCQCWDPHADEPEPGFCAKWVQHTFVTRRDALANASGANHLLELSLRCIGEQQHPEQGENLHPLGTPTARLLNAACFNPTLSLCCGGMSTKEEMRHATDS